MFTSVNEIETTVYKAMSSKGLADGVCVAAAKSASYLETMGIKVLTNLLHFLATPPHSIKPIDYNDANHTFDLHNISCIYWAQTAALLAMEKMEAMERAADNPNPNPNPNVILTHTHDSLFIIRHLRKAQAIIVAYDDIDTQQRRHIFISPNSTYPRALCTTLIKKNQTQRNIGNTRNTVQHNTHLSIYSEQHYQRCIDEASHVITEKEFAQTHQQSLLNGIEVDAADFQQLRHYAQKILVENTQASQQGAGADANIIDPEDIPIQTP